MPKLFTHIIVSANDGAVLYRASDGMVLAARQGTIVNMGEDPQRTQQRHFLDKYSAGKFLRVAAEHDDGCESVAACQCGTFNRRSPGFVSTVDIEDRDGDSRIITGPEVVGSGTRH